MVAGDQYSGCYVSGSNGPYLWTAGRRLDPGDILSSFVWKVTTRDSFKDYPMTYENWGSGEPNNWNGHAEDCLNILLEKATSWNDQRCSEETCFVCEFPA